MRGGGRAVNLRFVVVRGIRYSVILLLVLTINFMLPRMMPGDPVTNILGMDALWVDQSVVDTLTAQYGLDKSLAEQYVNYLASLFTLDMGYSIRMHAPVADLVASRIWVSVAFALPALILGSIIALTLGTYMGMKKGSMAERGVTSALVFIHSMPVFLLGMVMLSVFSFKLGIFSMGQFHEGATGIMSIFDTIYHLTLPITVLTIAIACSYYYVIHNSVVQIKEEYFIAAKRAHGISEDDIISKHVTRNVLTQFVSIFSINLGSVVSGSLIVETVFSINGMGTLLYNAIAANDYPLIQGCFIVITLSVLLANFFAELLYGIIDPRVADGGWA